MSARMDPRERILLAWSRLDEASYYDLLSIDRGADRAALQRAFHRFALAYHPDRHVELDDAMRDKARAMFQRGVEAYTVLRNERYASHYAERFAKGALRLTPEDMARLAHPPSIPPPARKPNSIFPFVDAMRTSDGAEVAERVERLLAEGRTQQAYQQLGLLELIEPDNAEVVRRMDAVGRALKRKG